MRHSENGIDHASLVEAANDALAGIQEHWPRFLDSDNLSPRQRLYRTQAINAFPCAMWIVVQTHCLKPGSIPARAAKEVIDAIDDGKRLIPSLAAFFQTNRGSIRKSRRWPLQATYGIPSRRTASRLINFLGNADSLPAKISNDWQLLQTCLPALDLMSRGWNIPPSIIVPRIERLLKGGLHLFPITLEPDAGKSFRSIYVARFEYCRMLKHQNNETASPDDNSPSTSKRPPRSTNHASLIRAMELLLIDALSICLRPTDFAEIRAAINDLRQG